MKILPPGMQAHLDTGTTTLCWCWRLTRRDGTVLGFTDHDRTIVFDATAFEASAGFTASDMTESAGLSVDNLEVTGAISSAVLTEEHLASGRYDDARVEVFRVNWADPSQRVLMRSGSLGEVRRAGHAFTAEVRGIAHYLQQPKGRLYQYTCDADLGDARCGVALASASLSCTATITAALSESKFQVSGAAAFAGGFFARGLAEFSSGPALGLKIEVKSHTSSNGAATIELWHDAPGPPAPGDTLVLKAGCDKHISTCAAKFNNAINFRGFPGMPGNDFLARSASSKT